MFERLMIEKIIAVCISHPQRLISHICVSHVIRISLRTKIMKRCRGMKNESPIVVTIERMKTSSITNDKQLIRATHENREE